MYLKEVLFNDSNIRFHKIVLNSKEVRKGDLFIPYGGCENRNKYIKDALDKGCSSVITEEFYPNKKVFLVKNLNKEIISIFNKYYSYPLNNLEVIGITGTDGKTTVASILSDLLNCPSIGTNGFLINEKNVSLKNTTPSLDVLYNCFHICRDSGFKNVVMEVSSESYLTNRIGELPFQIGIFTNITKDHLDKHKTFENYLNCKLKLLEHSKIAILNRDSKYYYKCKDHSINSYSYGFKKGSNLRIISYKLFFDKSFICFQYNGKKYKLFYPLVGKFNVYNIACCILTLLKLGYSMDEIQERMKNIKQVKGRMEIVYHKDFLVMIDYAHTTNATLNVLKFLKKYNKNIITIVGAAGDRYQEKRKEIGALVLKYSKFVIFTSDDPREEDPEKIIEEMLGNTKRKNYKKIIDRKKAISYAIEMHKPHDLLLILGKGRDEYMLIGRKKYPYSDYKVVMDLLKE